MIVTVTVTELNFTAICPQDGSAVWSSWSSMNQDELHQDDVGVAFKKVGKPTCMMKSKYGHLMATIG